MEFINVVSEKASELARSAAKTSGTMIETVKLKIAVAEKESEKKKLLADLGNLMFRAYKKGVEPAIDAVDKRCEALDVLCSELDELNDKLDQLKNTRVCPECETRYKADYKFCPDCGKKAD